MASDSAESNKEMRAWTYTSAAGGLENALKLTSTPKPPSLGKDEVLVQVHAMSVNPADIKIPELGLLSKLMVSTPASPGMDFCGRVAGLGSTITRFKEGDMVFGALGMPRKYGTLGEFAVAKQEECAKLPDGVEPTQAATLAVAGRTALQCLKRGDLQPGDKVFINGGSGGTGTFGIQIAKALRCHVTTSCSTKNIDLCKSLGADEVLDYTKVDLVEELKKQGQVFKLVVDNVGNRGDLFPAGNDYLVPEGRYVQIGGGVDMNSAKVMFGNALRPGFLGGGKRKWEFLKATNDPEGLEQLGMWMKEGKIKGVIEEAFEYDNAPAAVKKVKTGRVAGKVVVKVGE